MARTVTPSFVDHGPKLRVLKIAIKHWPKMANIRPGDPKTACRAHRWPPTRKLVLSLQFVAQKEIIALLLLLFQFFLSGHSKNGLHI